MCRQRSKRGIIKSVKNDRYATKKGGEAGLRGTKRIKASSNTGGTAMGKVTGSSSRKIKDGYISREKTQQLGGDSSAAYEEVQPTVGIVQMPCYFPMGCRRKKRKVKKKGRQDQCKKAGKWGGKEPFEVQNVYLNLKAKGWLYRRNSLVNGTTLGGEGMNLVGNEGKRISSRARLPNREANTWALVLRGGRVRKRGGGLRRW